MKEQIGLTEGEITDLMVIAQMAKTVGAAADAIKLIAERTAELEDRVKATNETLTNLIIKIRELESEQNLHLRGVK